MNYFVLISLLTLLLLSIITYNQKSIIYEIFSSQIKNQRIITTRAIHIISKTNDFSNYEGCIREDIDKYKENDLNRNHESEEEDSRHIISSNSKQQKEDGVFESTQFFNQSYFITQEQQSKINLILNTKMSSLLIYPISHFNKDEKLYAMNTLFPLITEYNEEFKEYYTYRQIYFKWNINSEAYRLHKQYTDFPDPSYYWVYPKGEEPKERHVLFGTYYVQHEIWKHQFPATCEDKKFLIVPIPWYGGLGYIINQLAYSLAAAIENDRILIIKKLYNTPWGDPGFCGSDNNSILCYLQPTTNCTVPDEDIQIAYNKNKDFVSNNHIHIKNITAITEYPSVKYICTDEIWRWRTEPSFVKNFLKSANIQFDRNVRWWYWRTQGITFLTRLNKRTINWIHDYEKRNCKECKNEYDITLHIRHADKGREMKLIDADVYKEAIKIITSLGMKKNYTIFVNADDQKSVDVIHTLPYHVISFNQSRLNYGVDKNKWQNKVGLISLSNLYNLLKGDYCVGTIASNWNQVFYELRSTVGLKSDGFNLEVGIEGCMSYSHCSFKKRRFDCKW